MADINQPKTLNLFRLLRTIFGIKLAVDRKTYLIVGLSLAVFKYAVEAFVIFQTTMMFFDPIAYVIPSLTYRNTFFQLAPDWVPWAMGLWSVPFVWIAVTMSVRRAIDAGMSPLVGVLVLLPFINLFTMFMLSLAPTDSESVPPYVQDNAIELQENKRLFVYAAILGVLIGGGFALAITIISANLMHNYGSSLFLGMPIVAGAAASFIYNQPHTRGFGGSIGVGLMAVAIGGFGLLLFAFEGVICLLMASPILLPLGAAGGVLGWFLSTVIILQSKWMLGGMLLPIVPFMGFLELMNKTYETHVVESSIIIKASPEDVWQNVIAFPEIDSPQPWYFRFGVAAPLRARIEGTGVGAVRHCEFTTGSFVEPITIWDQPKRLAFDVTDQPDPLIELTPYRNVRPPHLSHSFYSVQGEFELVPVDNGSTKLIGRTWYVIEMGPQAYWKLWTDEIIHHIHMRVLNHIDKSTVGPNSLPKTAMLQTASSVDGSSR